MVDDRGLYAPGQLWLQRKDVVGRARGYVPYIGMVTILMNDYPKFKVRPIQSILLLLGLFEPLSPNDYCTQGHFVITV